MFSKKLKTLLFAAATLTFMGCDDDNSTGPVLSETGTIEFAIIGEDIPYHNLEFENNLKVAKITYAYMLIKNPTLNGDHYYSRHAGETLEGTWAVDLMAKDTARTPVHLGYLPADTGLYNGEPEITMPAQPSTDADWNKITDAGGLTKLKEKNCSFLFGGTFTDQAGVEYPFEIREPLFTKTISIKEFPTATNGELGTKLHVGSDDTLLAKFQPHIDHALEVLDENPIDFATLEKEGDVIVISDTKNKTVTDKQNTTVNLYTDIVNHILKGDHWDVNVIPGD